MAIEKIIKALKKALNWSFKGFIVIAVLGAIISIIYLSVVSDYNSKLRQVKNCYDEKVTLVEQYLDYENEFCESCLVLHTKSQDSIIGADNRHFFPNNPSLKEEYGVGDTLVLTWCNLGDDKPYFINGVKVLK